MSRRNSRKSQVLRPKKVVYCSFYLTVTIYTYCTIKAIRNHFESIKIEATF